MSTSKDVDKGQSIARVHTNRSNRRARDNVESKTVFKSVFSNPFEVKWPIISPVVQNAVLARLTELLSDVAEFYGERRAKRKKGNRPKGVVDISETSENNAPSELGDSLPGTTTLTSHSPPILRDITIGINAVTKQLERQCHAPCITISSESSRETGASNSPSIRVVVVCKADIDSPTLVAHFPYLVSACNSITKSPGKAIKLVTLSKGSEVILSQALGLHRVAVLALNDSLADDPSLVALLESTPVVIAPWLSNAVMHGRSRYSEETPQKRSRAVDKGLIPTHIKQLRTTAPKDMRAAKELRAKSRARAKEKQRAAKAKKSVSEESQT